MHLLVLSVKEREGEVVGVKHCFVFFVLYKIDKNTKISELGSIKFMFAWLVKKCSLIPPLPCSPEYIFLDVLLTP